MPHDITKPHQAARQSRDDDDACAYILDGPDNPTGDPGVASCGAPVQPGSAYCPYHHARCHLRRGSCAEQHQLWVIELLAAVAGGRRGRPAREPPPPVLRRLDRRSRAFARHSRSCIVLKEGDDDASNC